MWYHTFFWEWWYYKVISQHLTADITEYYFLLEWGIDKQTSFARKERSKRFLYTMFPHPKKRGSWFEWTSISCHFKICIYISSCFDRLCKESSLLKVLSKKTNIIFPDQSQPKEQTMLSTGTWYIRKHGIIYRITHVY